MDNVKYLKIKNLFSFIFYYFYVFQVFDLNNSSIGNIIRGEIKIKPTLP